MTSTKTTTNSQMASTATQEGYNSAKSELDALQKQKDAARRTGGADAALAFDGKISAAQQKLNAQSGYVHTSASEDQANTMQNQGMTDMTNMVNSGPGQGDVQAGTDQQRSFANMLQQYQNGGFNPSAADTATARGQVNNLFAGQQTALNQQQAAQTKQANRNAALTGRGINDPIFQNQQNQLYTNQNQQLQSNMTSATQELANQQPAQRLQYADALTQSRMGLASQAMQNRQLLLSMGNQVREQERNFRLQAANKSNNTTNTEKSNPGALGIASAVIGGAGSLMSGGLGSMISGGLSSLMGGSSAGGANPQAIMNQFQAPTFGQSGPQGSSFGLSGGASSPSGMGGLFGAGTAQSSMPTQAAVPGAQSWTQGPNGMIANRAYGSGY